MTTIEAEGRRILVTGATGFIGSRVARLLASEHGATVTAGVRDPSRARDLEPLGIAVRRVDVGDRAAVEEAVRGQDAVIHTAHDFRASPRANCRGFEHVLDACRSLGVPRLVHTSSIVVYDDWPAGELREGAAWGAPGTEYENSKSEMERRVDETAHLGGLSVAILQPTIVYGPGGWIWTDRILEQLTTGTVVLPARCEGLCPVVYVDDVAQAMIRAATTSFEGVERFIVSGAEPVTWRRLFEAYDAIVGRGSLHVLEEPDEPGGGPAPGGDRRSGLLADPLRLAAAAPVRRLVGLAERAVGPERIRWLRSRLFSLIRRGRDVTYLPNDHDRMLYAARGRCRIDKAVQELGYAPAFDLDRGMACIAASIREDRSTPNAA